MPTTIMPFSVNVATGPTCQGTGDTAAKCVLLAPDVLLHALAIVDDTLLVLHRVLNVKNLPS